MNTSPDHPDFTALALGEHIHGAPAQALLDALRNDPAARGEAEQIRSVAKELTAALKRQPTQRLDTARRAAIFSADPAAVRARFAAEEKLAAMKRSAVALPAKRGRRHTWIFPTAAAAAVTVAALFALQVLPGFRLGGTQGPVTARTSMEGEPTGRVMVANPQTVVEASGVPVAAAPAFVEKVTPPSSPAKGPDLPLNPPPPVVAQEEPPVLPEISPPAAAPEPPAVKHPGIDPGKRDFATPFVRPKR